MSRRLSETWRPGGVEYVLDTSGPKENLDAGLAATARMRRFGFVAFNDHSGAVVDAFRLMVGQQLQGIIQGDAVSALMIPELIGLYRSGGFPFDCLITFYDWSWPKRARTAARVTSSSTHRPLRS
ncbi:hypothetical protein [Aureimonas glaciei]|uniref:Uncharacterized protein n=1 Tax=Aureimonas glaciei TaxID=1776957 RepID=A0A916YCQ9_9HYPH|nr:hypothetical protein [Aureimonas glaciei]GGD40206.1 hypothetical protein GCM10011335_48600 [Aureimonas glaciei]